MQKKSFCRRSSQPISWVSQSSHLSACSQVTTGSMLATHPNTLFSALHWWHLPLFTSTLFYYYHYHTHTHTHTTVYRPFDRDYLGKPVLDFTEASDSEWQWHQLGRMQVCSSLQTDNHASIPPLSFLQAGCPSCRPTNSVKALKATINQKLWTVFPTPIHVGLWHNVT